jgi:hypothetical protein
MTTYVYEYPGGSTASFYIEGDLIWCRFCSPVIREEYTHGQRGKRIAANIANLPELLSAPLM